MLIKNESSGSSIIFIPDVSSLFWSTYGQYIYIIIVSRSADPKSPLEVTSCVFILCRISIFLYYLSVISICLAMFFLLFIAYFGKCFFVFNVLYVTCLFILYIALDVRSSQYRSNVETVICPAHSSLFLFENTTG